MKKIIILIGAVLIVVGLGIFITLNNKDSDLIVEPGLIKNSIENATEATEPEIELNINKDINDLVIIPPAIMKEEGDSNENTTDTNNTEIAESDSININSQYILPESTEETTISQIELEDQQQDMAEIESQMAENVAINTRRDAIIMYRETAKANVKRLIVEGHTEFNGITDEMIDNYTEDEVMDLVWQITQIN